MPKFDHPTFGDIQNYVYLEGTILEVYLQDDAIDEAKWDTADVQYESTKVFSNAPIRYHCSASGIDRSNGAVVNGGRGFDVGDQVILMARIGETPGKGEEYQKVYVVGHRDGVVACTYNYLFIRISSSELIPHNPPYGKWENGFYFRDDPGSHSHEYCIVWDVGSDEPATIYNPETGVPYVFPVTIEEFKPAFDEFQFMDEELFSFGRQGDDEIQIAGFTPDWRADGQGNKIRDGAPVDAWWTSYNAYANPILNLFSNLQTAIALDQDGVSSGEFTRATDLLFESKESLSRWRTASPEAFNYDIRLYDVKGSDSQPILPADVQERLLELQAIIDNPLADDLVRRAAEIERDQILAQQVYIEWPVAHDQDMLPLQGSSYHLQTAFGEDEIWVCAKNTYQGMVITYCDEMWKFIRFARIPPVVAIPNPALEKILGTGPVGIPLFTSGQLIGHIAQALAAQTFIEQENNIFSIGGLKRINDGGFHRTTHPALKSEGYGSWRMVQNPIPATPLESTYITALNTRREIVDAWNRYDNWMMSMACSFATLGVDRTWWFKSNAQQWRITATYLDTPIGSMFYGSPVWEVALWHMDGFDTLFGGPVCRRDAPTATHFIRQTRHSKRVVAQVYIVQRQAATLWDDPTRRFVVQRVNTGIYDHFEPDEIKYVDGQGDGIVDDDYTLMSAAEKKAILSDRVYVRSAYPGEVGHSTPLPLRNNRNEIEIMAACDLYSTLKARFGRCNPRDQARNGRLEYEIQKLIAGYYADEGMGLKDFSEFKMEARIL